MDYLTLTSMASIREAMKASWQEEWSRMKGKMLREIKPKMRAGNFPVSEERERGNYG